MCRLSAGSEQVAADRTPDLDDEGTPQVVVVKG